MSGQAGSDTGRSTPMNITSQSKSETRSQKHSPADSQELRVLVEPGYALLISDAMNIVNKCLGRNTMSIGRVPQMPNLRADRHGKNMVRYNYYEVTLEDGSKKLMYAGSTIGIKRMLEDNGQKYLAIKEITYADAQKYKMEDLDSARAGTKGKYSSKGTRIVPKEWTQ